VAYGPEYPPPYYYGRLKVRFPDHAAVSTSPFLDMTIASVSWENRIEQFLNVGAQFGAYLGERVRVTARVALPTSSLSDQFSHSAYEDGNTIIEKSKAASLFYGATLGIVAVGNQTFVLAPGIAFMRTDVSDYGSTLGLSLPFEWVTGEGLRVGVELDLGRGFGGKYRELCTNNAYSSPCTFGERTKDRESGSALWLQFVLGFGFNHPAALAPDPATRESSPPVYRAPPPPPQYGY